MPNEIINKSRRFAKNLFIFGLFFTFTSYLLINPPQLESATLTSASDTLQSSRLSYSAQLASGHSSGDTIIAIDTGAATPNTTTEGLVKGDTVTIGSNTYTVQNIIDSDEFSITSGLQSGDETAGNSVYNKVTAQHDIDFTSATSVQDGSIRIYIENSLDISSANDGNPDGGANAGFDLNSLTGTNITCPTPSSSSITFTSPVATRSGDTASGGVSGWHTFECSYSGTLDASDALSNLYIGNGSGTDMINPAPDSSHSVGTADDYTVKIEILDSMANNRRVLDSVSMSTALIESVRVTATVDPQITFSICGADTCNDVEPGDIVDGDTLSSNTGATSTSTSVTLGTLSLTTSRLQAQKASIATNASTGYSLTATDDGNLRKGSDDIDDVVTPPTSPAALSGTGNEEYGIHASGSHVNTGIWGTGGGASNYYSGTDTSSTLTLVNHTSGPTASTDTYITYQTNISSITAQGDYAHAITYVATGTF